MATIREWLDASEFDWDKGVILFQELKDADYKPSPGWADSDEVLAAVKIDRDHPILDAEFHCGYGGPECPRFLAKDDSAIYHPGQYDGSTFLIKVETNIDHYLNENKLTPYPGG